MSAVMKYPSQAFLVDVDGDAGQAGRRNEAIRARVGAPASKGQGVGSFSSVSMTAGCAYLSPKALRLA
jgi:hypothetical protein